MPVSVQAKYGYGLTPSRAAVHWIEIANGQDAIQLGRLDNAVFRNVVEKEELASLLLDLTRDITPAALGIAPEDVPTTDSPDAIKTPQPTPLLPAGKIEVFRPGAPAGAEPKPAKTAKVKRPEPASEARGGSGDGKASQPPTNGTARLFKISRNGQIILEIPETSLAESLADGTLLPTDHCWTSGISGWVLVSQQVAGGAPSGMVSPSLPRQSASGKVLDFNVASSSGLILADNGMRYVFRAAEWRSHSSLPHPGAKVNFVVNGHEAIAIYAEGVPVSSIHQSGSAKSDGGQPGYYRSSDEKHVGGVCAGLAHRWNLSVLILRPVFLVLFPLLLAYLALWLILPERPTKVR